MRGGWNRVRIPVRDEREAGAQLMASLLKASPEGEGVPPKSETLGSAVLKDPDDSRAESESLPVNDGVPLLRQWQRHQAKELQGGSHGKDNPRMHEDA